VAARRGQPRVYNPVSDDLMKQGSSNDAPCRRRQIARRRKRLSACPAGGWEVHTVPLLSLVIPILVSAAVVFVVSSMFDGLIYGLLTDGVFGWLWPQ
jgi:hypothetical protein